MHFLYLDEAGGTERPDLSPESIPVMVLLGVIVHARLVPSLTRDFLALKRRYFPNRFDRGPALGPALRDLQYRYPDRSGRWRGGIVVSDPGGRRSGSLLFGSPDHKEDPEG